MTVPSQPFSSRALAATEPSDSLDVRLIVAGRLSPATVPLHHERAALAAVLTGTDRARTSPTTDPEGNAR